MMSSRKKVSKKTKRELSVRFAAVLISGVILELVSFLSFSWFSMNTDVSGSGMSVSVHAIQFDLAVPNRSGADTYYNSLINDFGYLTGDDELSTENGSIRWIMKDESKDTSAASYKGIGPGSYGKLTFYIIPKTNSNPKYNLRLDLTGYYAEFELDSHYIMTKHIVEDSFKSIAEKANGNPTSEYAKAAHYMKGHILFFQKHATLSSEELNGAVDPNKYYSGRIIDSFVYDTSEHQSDKTTINGQDAYEVNIYWIWPNTFGQIVLDSDDENLFGDALFSSKQSGEINPRTELTTYITSKPEYFFSSSNLQDSGTIASLITPTSLSYTNALKTLSNGYNGADQVIGENVQFVLVEMAVEPNIESEE